jgi:hypothetical protein
VRWLIHWTMVSPILRYLSARPTLRKQCDVVEMSSCQAPRQRAPRIVSLVSPTPSSNGVQTFVAR